MKDVRVVNQDFNPQTYNQKAPHPLQSWEWGEAREKVGIEVLRIGEFEGEKLKNVFQLTFHKIPYTNFKIGYLPRSVFPSEEVLKFLENEGKKRNAIFIKIEPYEINSKFKIQNSKLQVKIQNFDHLNIEHSLEIGNWKLEIVKSPHPLFPNWTIMVDLTKKEEELLKEMKPKTRYNIHLAEKRGVVVKEMTNENGFAIFAKLYFETCKRQKYFGHDLRYHKIIFETLKNKITHILIAFYKDTPLSAFEIFIFNDVLYYPYGGSSLEYRNLMGANLLMWKAMKFGKKNGVKTFDMWGSEGPNYDKNNQWSGFTRFKEGYGGKFVELIGSYDLIINQVFYKIYNLAHKGRQLLLKLR